jgi:hypothetical protein
MTNSGAKPVAADRGSNTRIEKIGDERCPYPIDIQMVSLNRRNPVQPSRVAEFSRKQTEKTTPIHCPQ